MAAVLCYNDCRTEVYLTMVAYLFWTAVSFFSGSVMYSYLIPKLFYGKDITKISKDGNRSLASGFPAASYVCCWSLPKALFRCGFR